jgi:lipopolysaccharide export system permease protein
MSAENEILAMRASGIHIRRLILPLLTLGIILSLTLYWLNDRIIPKSYDAQTRILQNTGAQNPTALLEAGSFINAFDKYIVFIYRIEGNRLFGIRIYEPQENNTTRTLIAQEGEFVRVPNSDKLLLKLINGTSDEPNPNNPNQSYKLNFQQSFITMDLSKKKKKEEKKPKGMLGRELTEKIDEYKAINIDPTPLLAEFHRRIAWSLTPLLFTLLAFPFSVITHRRAKSANLLFALIFGAPYYLLALAAQGLAVQNPDYTTIIMWVPTMIFSLIVIGLNWKLCAS